MSENKKNSKVTYLLIISAGIIIAVFCKLFVLDFLTISGQSMSPSIQENHLILINKMAYGLVKPMKDKYLLQWSSPKKDDVVIFLHNNKIVVKRCVLTQGESLEILYNQEYNSYYIQTGERQIPLSREQKKQLENCKTVPQGFIFVVGDNDRNSIDSRDYGFVSVKNITGRVVGK